MARRSSAATSAMAAARAAAAVQEATPKPTSVAGHETTKPRAADAQIDAALLRGERLKKVLPRATSARYDRKARMIVVTFANGAIFQFPTRIGAGLLQGDCRRTGSHSHSWKRGQLELGRAGYRSRGDWVAQPGIRYAQGAGQTRRPSEVARQNCRGAGQRRQGRQAAKDGERLMRQNKSQVSGLSLGVRGGDHYIATPAQVVELVDALDSKSCSERSVGSIPTLGTI